MTLSMIGLKYIANAKNSMLRILYFSAHVVGRGNYLTME